MTNRPGNKKDKSGTGDKPEPSEDARLLEHAFRDVEPLPGRKINADGPARPAAPKSPAPIIRRRAGKVASPAAAAKPKLPPLEMGAAPGLDKRMAQKLKRGKVEIDGRIDLHGMTQDRAYRALGDFLATSQSLGRRCVLVITGKGLNPETGAGVLKTATPRWLNEQPNRGRVLSFAQAQPQHGGGGALYVYLRRPK